VAEPVVHVVDGTYELFRAFYGPLNDGSELGGVRGLCSSLLSLLAEPEVTHVAVAFDTVIESFRNRLFDGYKTGAGIDAKLFAQFQPAEDMCRALGLVTWSMIEFECDDALATAAHRFSAHAQVVICSPDKDLAQCVNERVVVRDRMRKKTMNVVGVVEKFGVQPRQIPDWLGLVGDTADGIPGLPGFGEKTSSVLLQRYAHLEDIPDEAWDVKLRGVEALQQTWRARKADAMLYRTLATLRTDVPLTESVDDLAWRGPQEEHALWSQLGDKLRTRAVALRAKVHAPVLSQAHSSASASPVGKP
jgi:5'-3' exonuclease